MKVKIIKLLGILSIILSSITIANANITKFLCSGDTNYLYVIFDTEKKSVITGTGNPHDYFIQTDFRFWHTTSQHNNQTTVRSFIFHKPSGKMSVKSDNMITSGEQMYYHECVINQ